MIKVRLVFSPTISVIALGINSRGLFVDKIITILANEAVYLGVTYAIRIKVQGEISNHVSCQRQRSLCKVFDIAYELYFLL